MKRTFGIAAFGILVFAVGYAGLWSTARGATLLFMATAFSLIAFYEFSVREIRLEYSLLLVMGVCAAAGAAYFGLQYFAPLIPPSQNPLVADTAPTPVNACSNRSESGQLLMIFGADAFIGKGSGPFVPIKIGSCAFLKIERKGGGLSVNAFGYDSAGDLAYQIQNNQLTQMLDGGLKADRPDKSTLRILDDLGHERLMVDYLNKGTVQIRGVATCSGFPPVVFADGVTIRGGHSVQGRSCTVLAPGAEYGKRY